MVRFLFCIAIVALAGLLAGTFPREAEPGQLLRNLKHTPSLVRGEISNDLWTLPQDYDALPSQIKSLWNQIGSEARVVRADARADVHHLAGKITTREIR